MSVLVLPLTLVFPLARIVYDLDVAPTNEFMFMIDVVVPALRSSRVSESEVTGISTQGDRFLYTMLVPMFPPRRRE